MLWNVVGDIAVRNQRSAAEQAEWERLIAAARRSEDSVIYQPGSSARGHTIRNAVKPELDLSLLDAQIFAVSEAVAVFSWSDYVSPPSQHTDPVGRTRFDIERLPCSNCWRRSRCQSWCDEFADYVETTSGEARRRAKLGR